MNPTALRFLYAALRVVISLACVLGIACGCGGGTVSDPTSGGLDSLDKANAVLPVPVSVPYTLPRLAAADSSEPFRPSCRGAQYAADLSPTLCEAQGEYAEFNPDFDPQNGLGHSAYCFYRLRCFQQAETAELHLSWAGSPPPAGTCWIGLSDWQRGIWRWVQPPDDGIIPLSLGAFANENHQAFVAVVMLGVTPVELASITCVCEPNGTVPYHLFSRMNSRTTQLMDMDGNTVHSWESDYLAGCSVYLLEDGHLLRPYASFWPVMMVGEAIGLEELDWDGNLLWSVNLQQDGIYSHHDIEPLPNGNILLIVTDVFTAEEAVENGRNPAFVTNSGMYIDSLVEIQPVGDSGYEVIWEWHLKDHLVQDLDDTKSNYGSVEEQPGLLNINISDSPSPDFTHANSIDYNEKLDQVVITLRNTSELLIIDHSTTTSEAAGHTGGRSGIGGDILYRWGNPLAYRADALESQVLYQPHDAEWISEGYPGAGNLLMFSNGADRPDVHYSTVCEIAPPLNPDGTYILDPNSYLPASAVWEFVADPPELLFSSVMSGSQRLPDGNTLIFSSDQSWLLEVTPSGNITWDYTLEPVSQWESGVFRIDRYYLFTPWLDLVP